MRAIAAGGLFIHASLDVAFVSGGPLKKREARTTWKSVDPAGTAGFIKTLKSAGCLFLNL